RATVNEERAIGHWERSREGRGRSRMGSNHPYSRSQETGAIRLLQPLSREKEDGMRVLAGLFFVVLLGAAASAADLKAKVVEPQTAALAGAQVNLMPASGGKILATQNTSAEGAALFRMPTGAVSADYTDYKVQVLAPGFAAETVAVASQAEIT